MIKGKRGICASWFFPQFFRSLRQGTFDDSLDGDLLLNHSIAVKVMFNKLFLTFYGKILPYTLTPAPNAIKQKDTLWFVSLSLAWRLLRSLVWHWGSAMA